MVRVYIGYRNRNKIRRAHKMGGLMNSFLTCQRLMTVPGVRPVRALAYKTFVDDQTRFKHSQTLALHIAVHALVVHSPEWLSLRLTRTKVHRRAVNTVARKPAIFLKCILSKNNFIFCSKFFLQKFQRFFL